MAFPDASVDDFSGPAPMAPPRSETVYFHNGTGWDIDGTIRTTILNTTKGAVQGGVDLTGSQSVADLRFYQYPALARAMTLQGTVGIYLWIRQTSSQAMFARLTPYVYDISPIGVETLVATGAMVEYNPVSSIFTEYFVSVNVNRQFAQGHYVEVRVNVDTPASPDTFIRWGDETYPSRAILPVFDPFYVVDVVTLDWTRTPRFSFDPLAANKTIYLNTTIDDPFGGYDIKWVNVSLEGPSGKILAFSPMKKVGGSASSRLSYYEYSWNYSTYPVGQYNVTVQAVDNTGYYFRYPSHPDDVTFGGHRELGETMFYIGTAPVEVQMLVLDNASLPMSGAGIRVMTGSYVIASNATNASGRSSTYRPISMYRFIVVWQGVNVFDSNLIINSAKNYSSPLYLNCSVYYPKFKVVDVANLPIANALLYFTYPNGTSSSTPLVTDSSGVVSLSQYAGGKYAVLVEYRNTQVANVTLNVNSSSVYVIPASIYYLKVRVVYPSSTAIVGAIVRIYDNVTGIVVDSEFTNTTGYVVSRLPVGIYDLDAIWLETVVNSTKGVSLNANLTITLVAMIFPVDIKLVDSRGMPVEYAQVSIGSQSGKELVSDVSNLSGGVRFSLPAGVFTLLVTWKDLPVHSNSSFIVTKGMNAIIQVGVYYVAFDLLDQANKPVASASIGVTNGGRLLETNTTNYTGWVLARLPMGTHIVEAYWLGVLVNRTSYAVTKDDILVLKASIYYVDIKVVDSKSIGVEGAQVSASIGNLAVDFGITGPTGTTTLRLPVTAILLTATWYGVEVYRKSHSISGAPVTLNASIYYVVLNVVDSHSVAVENALVTTATSAGRLLFAGLSDAKGSLTLRTPVGTISVKVTWHSAEVYNNNLTVSGDANVVLNASIYYIKVTVVDSKSNPVLGVELHAARSGEMVSSALTDDKGSTIIRLPKGSNDLNAYWYTREVYSGKLDVAKDDNATIKAAIYYLSIVPEDSRAIAILGADIVVTVENRTIESKIYSAGVQFRAPKGDVDINVTWRRIAVASLTHAVTLDEEVKVTCSVYYAKTIPTDSRGIALPGASVTVVHGGFVLEQANTPQSGEVEFRLPAETYSIDVEWLGHQVFTGERNITSDITLNLSSKVYYLKVRVVASDGRGIDNAEVNIYEPALVASGYTNNSESEFRLPSWNYQIVVHLKTTYYMTAVDLTEKRNASLTKDMTVEVVLEGYPLQIWSTGLFEVVLILLILIILLLLTVYLIRRKKRAEGGEKGEGKELSAEESKKKETSGKEETRPTIIPLAKGEEVERSELPGDEPVEKEEPSEEKPKEDISHESEERKEEVAPPPQGEKIPEIEKEPPAPPATEEPKADVKHRPNTMGTDMIFIPDDRGELKPLGQSTMTQKPQAGSAGDPNKLFDKIDGLAEEEKDGKKESGN
jgi:outer membrane biosynthesis protein TonB